MRLGIQLPCKRQAPQIQLQFPQWQRGPRRSVRGLRQRRQLLLRHRRGQWVHQLAVGAVAWELGEQQAFGPKQLPQRHASESRDRRRRGQQQATSCCEGVSFQFIIARSQVTNSQNLCQCRAPGEQGTSQPLGLGFKRLAVVQSDFGKVHELQQVLHMKHHPINIPLFHPIIAFIAFIAFIINGCLRPCELLCCFLAKLRKQLKLLLPIYLSQARA
mmetsp:Transcript_31173/g.67224  ORF Transcript_31173/g.67224 Transcript_31173/m.67224 type:complete len:216 (+) Transcript_31173:307-954(+)